MNPGLFLLRKRLRRTDDPLDGADHRVRFVRPDAQALTTLQQDLDRLEARDVVQHPTRVQVDTPPVVPGVADRLVVTDVGEGDALPDQAEGEVEAEVPVVHDDRQRREHCHQQQDDGDEDERQGTIIDRRDEQRCHCGNGDQRDDDGPASLRVTITMTHH